MRRSNPLLSWILLIFFLGSFLVGEGVEIAVDWLWFEALGFLDVFTTSLTARIGMWVAGFVISAAVLGSNVRTAWRRVPMNFINLGPGLEEIRLSAVQLRRFIGFGLAGLVLLLSMSFADVASRRWMDVLSYMHRTSFGNTDPIFARDIGFFFFELPIIEFVRAFISRLVMVSLVFVSSMHFGAELLIDARLNRQHKAARAHILMLGSLLFVLAAIGFWLDRFALLFNQRGVVYGAGYADIHAQLPTFWIMAALSLVVAAALAWSASRDEGWRVPGGAVGGFVAAEILISGLYPSVIQSLVVDPSELELEKPFLDHNINATREAYALDRIEVRPFEADEILTMDDVEANPLTINNIRIWDTRPLLTTYGQLQEIRLYYDFVDVDVDRYRVDGELRQVMLSARELNYEGVPEQAKSWVNEHFQYTHGYGLTMSPVNVVTREGLPELFVKDIPPETSLDLDLSRPEIYYGERTDHYVLVKTSADEFDYPMGDQNKYTTYAGEGGVEIGGLGERALFAMYYQTMDLLLSKYIQPESRILFRRRVQERLLTVAPFLQYDSDPYLVAADGRMYWICDAYTVSDRYPYSEPWGKNFRSRFNYIRNSVKAVVDAYDGTVWFYVSDPDDPLIQVYGEIFPEVFRPMDEMPGSLQEHQRYPTDFFDVQAEMYRAYHMTDSTVFYNKEDMWEVPQELYGGRAQKMESYYLIMKLPDEDAAEFVLLLPFVPTNRDNMISWLAARSDPPNYGKLVLYQFPKQKLIFGPRQIEARIDQDPEISELMTLWSQAGSQVVRGNLLVIPIERSLLYVEPLYLQADSSELPELKRVIVSYENRIAMRETLDEALRAVFDVEDALDLPELPEAGEPGEVVPDAVGAEAGWTRLVTQANQQLARANERQRAGDWAGYGQALAALESTLKELDQVAGGLRSPAAPAPEIDEDSAGGADDSDGE